MTFPFFSFSFPFLLRIVCSEEKERGMHGGASHQKILTEGKKTYKVFANVNNRSRVSAPREQLFLHIGRMWCVLLQ